MRIQHKPEEVRQVDWAGTTIPYRDLITDETYPAYVFIAVLPCSCYAYVEACEDMKAANWLLCHVHAYEYFGGVTKLLIPDNLKTGVVKNTRYDTVLNRSYQEMAEYYETAIMPARVLHPKDKSLAEGTVKFATTWVIAALRNLKFFSFEEVRQTVAEKLEELNWTSCRQKLPWKYSFMAQGWTRIQEFPDSAGMRSPSWSICQWSTGNTSLTMQMSSLAGHRRWVSYTTCR